MQSKS
jgi:hypothetical protein